MTHLSVELDGRNFVVVLVSTPEVAQTSRLAALAPIRDAVGMLPYSCDAIKQNIY